LKNELFFDLLIEEKWQTFQWKINDWFLLSYVVYLICNQKASEAGS
jgi:hypothetical protein